METFTLTESLKPFTLTEAPLPKLQEDSAGK
jgi:hypothetical protein